MRSSSTPSSSSSSFSSSSSIHSRGGASSFSSSLSRGTDLDEIGKFELLCDDLMNPRKMDTATKELELLKQSNRAIPLAKQVLERTTAFPAQLYATQTLRSAVLRQWTTINPDERSGIRDWLLNLVANRCGELSTPAIDQLVIAIVVLWKRGWIEENQANKDTFFEYITELLETNDADSTTHQALGVRLCLTLVQEMALEGGGKSTALGLSSEFHKQTANEFQKNGLHECFFLPLKLLLSRLENTGTNTDLNKSTKNNNNTMTTTHPGEIPGVPTEIVKGILETISACLSWDFSGQWLNAHNNNSVTTVSSARVAPGASWRELLADEDNTVTMTILSMYENARTERPNVSISLATLLRQVLIRLCGVEGGVFASPVSMANYGYRLVMGIASYMDNSLYALIPQLTERDRKSGPLSEYVGEDIYYDSADREGLDLCNGLAIAIRTYTLNKMSQVTPNSNELPQLFVAVTHFACSLLDEFYNVAQEVLETYDAASSSPGSTGSSNIHSSASSSSSSSNTSINRSKLSQTKRKFQALLNERYTSTMDTMDSVLEFWVAAILELEPVMLIATGVRNPESEQEEESVNALSPLLEATQELASDFFERLIRTRLAMASATMRCGINDDDEHEDISKLNEHLDNVGTLGRFVPSTALPLLRELITQARQKLIVLCDPSSEQYIHERIDSTEAEYRYAQAHEECWWLIGYAGHVLADTVNGERGTIPPTLNYLSRSERKPGALSQAMVDNDPIILLTNELFNLVHIEMTRLLSNNNHDSLYLSPLHATRINWFINRWANTYLMPTLGSDDGESASGIAEGGALSPVLSLGYGGDIATIFNTINQSKKSDNVLQIVPVEPDVTGGRNVLELLIRYSIVTLGYWGAQQSDSQVGNAALDVLRTLATSKRIAKFIVLSPSWSILGETTLALISDDTESIKTTANSSNNEDDSWRSSLSALPELGPESQGRLVSILLAVTHAIGYESNGYDEAMKVSSDEGMLAEASEQFPGVQEIVERWNGYYTPFITGAHEQLEAVFQSSLFQTTPTDPAIEREIIRLLHIHTGIISISASSIPASWHLPATANALSSCAALVDTYKAIGAVTFECLHYIHEFLDIDVHAISDEPRKDMYSALTDVFQAYAKHHTDVLKPVLNGTKSSGGNGTKRNPSSSVGFKSNTSTSYYGKMMEATEDETVIDILMLLQILDRIAERDTLENLDIDAADTSPAGATMMTGLAYLVPLLSGSILDRPGLVSAYMSIVTHIMSRSPSAVARMDSDLFALFIDNLESALSHYDTNNVVITAMDAIHSLATYHYGVQRKLHSSSNGVNKVNNSSYRSLDLSNQLQRLPDLFPRFARALLELAVGETLPPPSLHDRLAYTLFVCILCDTEGYQNMVIQLLEEQSNRGDNDTVERLQHEFEVLQEKLENALETGQKLAEQKLRSTGKLNNSNNSTLIHSLADRQSREAFREPFYKFMMNVRGFTTIV